MTYKNFSESIRARQEALAESHETFLTKYKKDASKAIVCVIGLGVLILFAGIGASRNQVPVQNGSTVEQIAE